MTFYQDLTPYEYFARNEPNGLISLNIGWLGYFQPFATGETSQEFKTRLFEFSQDKYVIHVARGFHVCEFCKVSDGEWFRLQQSRYGDKAYRMSVGNGEIRILGKSVVYAAPTLIYHYVTEHQYRPPDEFIEAVLTSPPPESNEYRALLQKFDNG